MHGPKTPADEWSDLDRSTKTVVVVDLVESVRLMQRDEAGVIACWLRFVHEVRTELLPARAGRMVKSLGDGLLLEFDSVAAGVAAALELQTRIGSYRLSPPGTQRLQLRVGVHRCEVVRDEHDIYGPGVNLSARIASLAGPGEIVASMSLAEQLVPDVDARLEDMGECWLKHLDQPVHCVRLLHPDRPLRLVPPAAEPREHALTERVQARIAVLSFQVQGGGLLPHDEVIGELLAESLIAQLSRSPELQLISHLSTRQLRQRRLAPEGIGALTGAAYVLTGSVLAQGEQLLIHAELLETRDAAVVWAERLQCRRTELLQVPSPPLHQLATGAHQAVLSTEARRALTQPLPTLEGYSLLAGSLGLLYRSTPQEFQRAREGLELLAERVPRHGAAYAWLAKWHILRIVRGQTDSLERERQEALWRVEQSLERDSASAIAWSLHGLVHGFLDKDLAQADQAYAQALMNNPSEPLAWLFTATLRSWQGRGADAAQAAERALALAPMDPMRYYYESLAAAGFLADGRYAQAQALCLSSLRLNRAHTPTYRVLAIAQMLAGDAEAARATVRQLRALEPQLSVGQYLARYPGTAAQAQLYADALKDAGLPA